MNKKAAYLILISLCLVIYANSLNGAFVSDDLPAILENPRIAQFSHAWTNPQLLLNSLSYLIAGFNPLIYHLISIFLHSINTILVFLFLSIFFKSPASFLGACLFALHPINSEAVCWVSARPYLITTLFILITYLLYYHAQNLRPKNKQGLSLPYIFALIIFLYYIIDNYPFFSFFPLFLILIDLALGKGLKNWRYWLVFMVIVVFRIILAQHSLIQRISMMQSQVAFPSANPLFYFAYSFYNHLGLLLWPAKLTLYHEPIVCSPLLLHYSLLYLLPVILALLLAYKYAKELFLGLAIFIIFLAPTYAPTPISFVVAERYAYFPSIALSIAVAFLYQRTAAKFPKLKPYLLAILILLIFAYGVRTIIRNQDWQTAERLWKKTAEASPRSVRAHNNLGLVYAQKNNSAKALEEYNLAIEIEPNFSAAYNNRGNLYAGLNNFEQALFDYNSALEINSGDAEAYANRGNIYAKMGYLQQAMSDYNKSIELKSDYGKAYNNRAIVYFIKKEYNKSWEDIKKAEALQCVVYPPFLQALKNASGREK
ncbi:MAG: tetratricopeptide repeat protein [Candidatus Omnitrophota bacterium]